MSEDSILIVDDQMGIRKLLVEVFKDNYKVEEAKSGLEAIEKIKEQMPSIILLDMMMPDMSGQETLATIRQKSATVPVLVMTGREIESLQAGGELDTPYYISKPFDIFDIRQQVEEILTSSLEQRKISC